LSDQERKLLALGMKELFSFCSQELFGRVSEPAEEPIPGTPAAVDLMVLQGFFMVDCKLHKE